MIEAVSNDQVFYVFFTWGSQENNSLPLPKLEGDDRAQARALATLYSHPVVSLRL